MTTRHTLTIQHRETGQVSQVLDVTGWSAHNFDRLWDGLTRKINFETWEPVYDPPRGDDETDAEWLRRA